MRTSNGAGATGRDPHSKMPSIAAYIMILESHEASIRSSLIEHRWGLARFLVLLKSHIL